MMTNQSLCRAVYDKIRGILSRAARETNGKFAMECEFIATELGNCARKKWDPYRMDKIATKCKGGLAKELEEMVGERRENECDRIGKQKQKAEGRKQKGRAIGRSHVHPVFARHD